ncbi:MAG: hypothetical protein PF551_04300 [Candidatus Marinimicrobia bacterium]|nr:hypothetical protein [Candidatus Neomarinimicrobiota bacterium]
MSNSIKQPQGTPKTHNGYKKILLNGLGEDFCRFSDGKRYKGKK